MTVSDLSLTELKALVYDHLLNIEKSQESIRAINLEIQKRNQLPKLEPEISQVDASQKE